MTFFNNIFGAFSLVLVAMPLVWWMTKRFQHELPLLKHVPPRRCTSPVLRIMLMNIICYTGLANLWPKTFGARQAQLVHFEEAFQKLPFADFDKGLFNLDGDPFWINGPLHAVYGSEAYMAARNSGHSAGICFIVAVLASASWEFLIESWFQRPSVFDLIWTPVAGAVLGEIRFQLMSPSFRDVSAKSKHIIIQIIQILFNPLYFVNRIYG